MWQLAFVKTLQDEFKEKQRRNSRFSMRSFARKIEISPGNLSLLFSGKANWKISKEKAVQILSALEISKFRKNKILVEMGETPQKDKKKISEDDYVFLKDLSFFPILLSFGLPSPFNEISSIAKRLNLKESEVQKRVDHLVKNGWLSRDSSGQLTSRGIDWEMEDDIPNPFFAKFHKDSLAQSISAIDNIPVQRREYQALSLMTNESKILEIKKECREFIDRIAIIADAGEENNCVYQMNLNFFPVEMS